MINVMKIIKDVLNYEKNREELKAALKSSIENRATKLEALKEDYQGLLKDLQEKERIDREMIKYLMATGVSAEEAVQTVVL